MIRSRSQTPDLGRLAARQDLIPPPGPPAVKEKPK